MAGQGRAGQANMANGSPILRLRILTQLGDTNWCSPLHGFAFHLEAAFAVLCCVAF